MLLLCGFSALFLAFQGTDALTVTAQPQDNATLVGTNATLICEVTNIGGSDQVKWKKYASGSSLSTLTLDNTVVDDASKYALVGTYNLTIINAQSTDTGTYLCSTGTDYTAQFTAVDLPTNLEIYWDGTYADGATLNLTCKATNGLPPPSLKWLIDGSDVTSSAYYVNGSTTSAGYGDAYSYLPLTISSAYDGKVAYCQVYYPGWENAKEASFSINGSPKKKSAVTVVLLMATIFGCLW